MPAILVSRAKAIDSGHLRPVGLLLAAGLLVRLLTACALHQPGYTDAYYYAVGARQLSTGEGLSEPFVWNYLDPPESLPHPGYEYWMPLPALLGWVGSLVLGDSFRAMQAPSVLLSALLPLVAYGIAWDLTRQRRYAILAGALGIFPGFYTHYLVLPDTFAPFALAGSVCLWALGRGIRDGRRAWLGLAGLAAGLAHLTRADGLLLLGLALGSTLLSSGQVEGREAPWPGSLRRRLQGVLLVLAGYLLVMGPWFARTWAATGSVLPGAGLKTAFLTAYDDVFAYGKPLTLEGYLAGGSGAILRSKVDALGLNLQRLLVENLQIFLLPLVVLGMWRLRRARLLWPFFVYLPLLFGTMTFVFTFPGMRGGLFHSGGALLPFFYAIAGPGLDTALGWAARRFRTWRAQTAWPVFSAGTVALAIAVTGLALLQSGVLSGEWNQRNQAYAAIGEWIAEQRASSAVVMVGDAPAFTWHTGHRSVAVPNSPLDTVLAVADRYAARYLVLDPWRPRTTDNLYRGEVTEPRLGLRVTVRADGLEWQCYEILPPAGQP